jgi:uncharacterized membrane protein YtjA (UPF0391 family)
VRRGSVVRSTPRGGVRRDSIPKELPMLRWALLFLIVALIAGVLGFGGIAADSAWIAKVLFVVFLIMFLVSMVLGYRPRSIT